MNTHDLFLACLRDPVSTAKRESVATVNTDANAAVDWAAIVAMAEAQGLAPLLYHRLRTWQAAPLLPPALWQALKQAHLQNFLRNHQLYQQLATLLTAFQRAQIEVIVLKGAYLAATVYENMALRTMGDLDLLVAPTALPATIALLTQFGYTPLTPIAPLEDYFTYAHHLPRFMKAGAPSVEVHWTITRPNHTYTIAVAPLRQRAQICQFGGVTGLALCPEDLLLHICLHATYQHLLQQGVRFLCDLDAIVRHFGATLDWQQVCQRAQDWGWARGVYLALHLAQKSLGTPIPATVLQTLQPAGAPAKVAELSRYSAQQTDAVAQEFVQMWQEPRLLTKVRQLGQRIFLPRAILAAAYQLTPDSPWLPWYYLVRIYDLLLRYGPIALQPKQSTQWDALRQRSTLWRWLEEGVDT
ncbi:MAG: hypothetical protein DYG89_16015 [Caldilinea sp. CFX5]|nr:hypothetical protein [Caldilinea sp. CFX5]